MEYQVNLRPVEQDVAVEDKGTWVSEGEFYWRGWSSSLVRDAHVRPVFIIGKKTESLPMHAVQLFPLCFAIRWGLLQLSRGMASFLAYRMLFCGS